MEMEHQLEICGVNEMTLLTHTTASGCRAIFGAVSSAVEKSQVLGFMCFSIYSRLGEGHAVSSGGGADE